MPRATTTGSTESAGTQSMPSARRQLGSDSRRSRAQQKANQIPIVGDRVRFLINGGQVEGKVAFVGPTSFGNGDWIGVTLDEPIGRNDGSVNGKQYFDCQDKHGMFIRPQMVSKIISCSAAADLRLSAGTVCSDLGQRQSDDRIVSPSDAVPRRHSDVPPTTPFSIGHKHQDAIQAEEEHSPGKREEADPEDANQDEIAQLRERVKALEADRETMLLRASAIGIDAGDAVVVSSIESNRQMENRIVDLEEQLLDARQGETDRSVTELGAILTFVQEQSSRTGIAELDAGQDAIAERLQTRIAELEAERGRKEALNEWGSRAPEDTLAPQASERTSLVWNAAVGKGELELEAQLSKAQRRVAALEEELVKSRRAMQEWVNERQEGWWSFLSSNMCTLGRPAA